MLALDRKKQIALARALVLIILLIGVALVLAGRGMMRAQAVTDFVASYPAAPAVYVAVHVAGSLFFVPRTILGIAAGLLFGFWGGLLWASVGGTAGAAVGFLLARYLNAGLIEPESLPRLGPALARAEEGGWRAVAVLRMLPLPHTPVNYALGLTKLPFGAYFFGSLFGLIPYSIAFVEFGASGSQALDGKASLIEPTFWGLVIILLSALVPRLATLRKGR
jgi:uncharacterized membrane protein YdjX (TVP38/TMEM64 family)